MIDELDDVIDEAAVEAREEASTEVDETVDAVMAFEIPDDPEAIASLVIELLDARSQAAEVEDKWKRAVAEFDNYRKRFQRDQAALIARASERVLVRLLPVLDSLDAAIAMEHGTSPDENLRQGLSGTRDLLLSTLAREGMEPIEALGTVFDPNLHEAAQIGEGNGTMVVEAEWRRGYTLNGRVVRATLVSVGYETRGSEDTTGDEQVAE